MSTKQTTLFQDELAEITRPTAEKSKTGNEVCAIVSTKVTQDQYDRYHALCAKYGITPYEEMQTHVLLRLLQDGYPEYVHDNLPEVEDYIETFTFGSEDAIQALGSLRHINAMNTTSGADGAIEHVIIQRRGGIIQVFDPRGNDGFGSVDGSLDKALEILLCSRRKGLRDVLHRICDERGTRSLYFAMYRLIVEEYRYLHEQLSDEQLDYAQNEYGNVPKQKRNKTFNPD